MGAWWPVSNDVILADPDAPERLSFIGYEIRPHCVQTVIRLPIEPSTSIDHESSGPRMQIICLVCGAEGGWADDLAAAIALWEKLRAAGMDDPRVPRPDPGHQP